MNAIARAISRPDWPRLMSEADAAAYLSIGVSALREHGPSPSHEPGGPFGRRTLWDRRDLDRFADAMNGQPLTPEEAAAESSDEERRFFEERQRRG